MKLHLLTLAAAALSMTSLQAVMMDLGNCGVLIGHTDGSGVFNGSGAPYKGADKYANWAIDQIDPNIYTQPDAADFIKNDTSNPTVTIGPDSGFVMVHWGGGQSGDHEYELYSVADCVAGTYHIPAPSQNGVSWIGEFGNGQTVPDGGTTALLFGLALLAMVPLKKLMSHKS